MKVSLKNRPISRATALLLFICLSNILNAQETESSNLKVNRFSSSVSITTKGISTIPNLTLGKPAVVFDMVIGRKFTFEPQFRYSLEGKPWAVVFWGRYNVISNEKFRMNVGANPSISFKSITDVSSGSPVEYIRAGRHFAAEIAPSFPISKNFNIGAYFFYSHGIDDYLTKHTELIALRSSITNIPITKQFVLRISPQIYYLNMDKKEGLYFNSTVAVSKRDFPVSITALINKTITSNIQSGSDFLWNVSLIYTFNKEYIENN